MPHARAAGVCPFLCAFSAPASRERQDSPTSLVASVSQGFLNADRGNQNQRSKMGSRSIHHTPDTFVVLSLFVFISVARPPSDSTMHPARLRTFTAGILVADSSRVSLLQQLRPLPPRCRDATKRISQQ
uniref:Uncharacterized protein n=1 Tax=Vitrella brassicaformis TaxID=1169539 RepID=A0A7S1PDS5_9ALVE|mmetsp:Transcript_6522/g.15778  ORF Transcript_6522/g.15778 Transcript_6522/m.15778 type:complete len:129 (+) Transcript_6522:81-467(+)